MKKKPKITAIRQLTQTKLFNIEEVDLEFSNGTKSCYERIKGSSTGGGVLIIPILGEQFILVSEYCVGVERYELMFPKGKIENNEPPIEAANRELQEEVGYAAKNLTYLKSMTLAPGYIGHTTHIVLAKDLYPSQLQGDEPEPLIIEKFSFKEIDDLIWREDVTEGRTIAALLLIKSLWEKGELSP